MYLFSIVVLSVTAAIQYVQGCDQGSFWQVTDIHYDANYSHISEELEICQNGEGKFGEYPCDSPWTLITSALGWMKQTQPQPDFILWTGDSVPHEPDSALNPNKVFTLIKNVTDALLETFPEVVIYPTIGNHDIWPTNQVPSNMNAGYYQSLLQECGWEKMLGDNLGQQFAKGGFYAVTRGSLVLLGLNSIVWYDQNRTPANQSDPLEQFMWLKQQLQEARNTGKKVLLHGHVPPGTLARAPLPWFIPTFNRAFLDILQDYEEVISAAIFGHEHTDSFRVVYSKQNVPSIPMFLTPAITPWESTIPGLGAVNPSLRLFHYCRDSGEITDYDQYYLNLSLANEQGKAMWELEYRPTSAFDIPDVSAKSLDKTARNFAENDANFGKYFSYNSVCQDLKSSCDAGCKRQHICAILFVDYDDYKRCIEDRKSNAVNIGFVAKDFDDIWDLLDDDDNDENDEHRRRFYDDEDDEYRHRHDDEDDRDDRDEEDRYKYYHRDSEIPPVMYYIIVGLSLLITAMLVVMLGMWICSVDENSPERRYILLRSEV